MVGPITRGQSLGCHPAASNVGGRSTIIRTGRFRHPGAESFLPAITSSSSTATRVELIKRGQAYVCDLTPEETEAYRGAPDKPGRNSPFRDRPIPENLDLFTRMRAGEFPNGARSLRAKIDMTSPNIWLRDPLLYRIRHTAHHHAGDNWCIYPLYDLAHCLSDYLEGITHSICTLEFEVHRPLYDWLLQSLELPRPLPRQSEFAQLNMSYMVFSKRRLLQLVDEGFVQGWDDPRLPTLSGARRRGIPASAIRRLAAAVGVTKYEGVTDIALFEHAIREELNVFATRRLAVLRPLAGATNVPPAKPWSARPRTTAGGGAHHAKIALTREIFIEREDFAEEPPPNISA